MNFVGAAFAILSTLIASVGMLLFKKASAKKKPLNVHFVLGSLFFLAGTCAFIIALKFDELSNLFPLTSLTYIWVMIWSVTVLKEKLNRYKILAACLIIVGILLISQ